MSYPTDPKSVQQALKVASALANPTIDEKNWNGLQERFKLNDTVLTGIKKLLEAAQKSPEVTLVLRCLAHKEQS